MVSDEPGMTDRVARGGEPNAWHQLAAEQVVAGLQSDAAAGLSSAEGDRRLKVGGPNELVEKGARSPWRILWDQLSAVMVVVLILAAVVSAALGDYKDAVVIGAIVILYALLGFVQEYRAEQAIAALKRLTVPMVKVRRDGTVREISASHLVPGDVLLLEAGNLVPADGRLLEAVNLRVQEAALTGESEPVDKDTEARPQPELPLGDRRNMVYMGTSVASGRGLAVVVQTGMHTELGNVASLIQSVRHEPTPLQKRLDQLGRALAVTALAVAVLVFGLGLLRGEDLKLMLLTAISVAVAAVPEGLPAVVTITLALGAQRMLKRQALIRKLPAVETLGSVTVICSDKTGTLTENRMTVVVLDLAGHRLDLTEELRHQHPVLSLEGTPPAPATTHPAIAPLLAGGALCNDALLLCDRQPCEFHTVGDPTEAALLVAAGRYGLLKGPLESAFPRLLEIPFDSERKRMLTVHEVTSASSPSFGLDIVLHPPGGRGAPSPYVAFAKGAVDSLLHVSVAVLVNGAEEPLSAAWQSRVVAANERLAGDGMRVLGVAYRRLDALPDGPTPDALERDLVFVGLVGMIDPPRAEVEEAVRICKTAGIRPVMITGDHPLTAQFIARELGIAADGHVLTGQDLATLSPAALEQSVGDVAVYARVSPEQKLKIVQALQDRGQVVAMTGDGVNDAPALKKADIGVAMGITGTDVAKEAADMVLRDDNFATIVAAVEEGRVIYDNVRKFIQFSIGGNIGKILVVLVGPLLDMPLPLLPVQLLWLNLLTDGLLGLGLGVEGPERDTMRRPPVSPRESPFSRGAGLHIVRMGLVIGVVALVAGFWYWRLGRPEWQTVVFTTLAFSQMGQALAVRSNRDSLFHIGLFSNKPLFGLLLLALLAQLLVVYLPFMQGFFGTTALDLEEMTVSLALGSAIFVWVEVGKWLGRRVSPPHPGS